MNDNPRKTDWLSKRMDQWAGFVVRHPWLIIVVSVAIALTGGYLASHIGIRSDFKELLPEHEQSVIDAEAISKRMGGMGTLIIELTGGEIKNMQRFADDLAAKLKTYPEKEVRFVDYKVDTQREFFEKHKWLYLSLDELSELNDGITDRLSKEKLKATGMYIDLEEGEEGAGEELDFKKKREEYERKTKKFDKYIDDYITNEEGTTLLVVIKTPGSATSVKFAGRIVKKVEKDILALNPGSYDPKMEYYLTGGLKTLGEEYYALRDDIIVVSNICVGLVLLAVALYYRSLRMTMILSIGLLAGVLTTMGLTYLRIGYLTAATAFLSSIVAGNGINYGIYFLARYMEERTQGKPIQETLSRSLSGTVRSVSIASAAAGASYLSLMATDFRGFNQFGFIGGTGMLICLLFALTLDPALAVIMERYFPPKRENRKDLEKGRIFSHGAAWLVENHPKKIFWGGVALTLASTVILAFFLRDPFEYNYRKLRNQYSEKSGSGHHSGKAEKILGERSSPHIILADNFEQVQALKTELEKYTETAEDPDKYVIKNVKTVYDYLPGTQKEQKKKIWLLQEIRQKIVDNDFSFLDKEDLDLLHELTPPAGIQPVTMDDLPDEIMRKFIEDNGTRGTPIYVYMRDGMSVWRGRDLMKFAAVVREIKIPSGETVRSSGHSVIFSDMLRYVSDEGPWATLGAFLFVTLVIVVSFRNAAHSIILTLAMLSGVILQLGLAIVFGQKINFLNYIAIPIEFGIGVDYSVNLYTRYLQEGPGSIGRVLRSTGGAVMITSLTTIIGYGALWLSLNGAINSFGTLANMGEYTCLAVAVLILPAYLVLYRGGLKKE